MLINRRQSCFLAALLATAASPCLAAAPPLVTTAIDDSATVTLPGSHAGAIAYAVDSGAIEPTHLLPHVILNLKRSPAMQAAFDALVEAQQTQGSPSYHRWLTLTQLRDHGPAQEDIDKVTGWLRAHGLTVNAVSPSGMTIDFGGTVSQIAAAFHTALHRYTLRGEVHTANTADVAIPLALSPVVGGVTLSNFFPRPNAVPAKPLFTIGLGRGVTPFFAVVPEDFATIYNLNPLLNGTNAFGTADYRRCGDDCRG